MDADARASLDSALEGLRGAGPMTSKDRKMQREAERHEDGEGAGTACASGARAAKARARRAFDVGRLADRRAAELVDEVKEFLAGGGAAGRRVRISAAEAAALWDGWRRKREAQGVDSLGQVLLEIARRMPGRGRAVVEGVAGEEKEDELREESGRLGESFRGHVRRRRRVRFECSMLQTAVESVDGSVSWRDVACGDEDDFDALWSRRWLLGDSVKEDRVLLVPAERPEGWQPACMLNTWESDGGSVLLCKVLGVEAARGASHDGEVAASGSASITAGGSEVLGRCSRYNTRLQARLAKEAAMESSGNVRVSEHGRPSGRARRQNQWSACETIMLQPLRARTDGHKSVQCQLRLRRPIGGDVFKTVGMPGAVQVGGCAPKGTQVRNLKSLLMSLN